MERIDILEILSRDNINCNLDMICKIHHYTKLYLLTAEEIAEEGVTFLQPLKEHRDAYDHLIRIFTLSTKEIGEQEAEAYVIDNIKKALGHEYRAFFDMADWFTYICRKKIRETLSLRVKRKRYIESYDDFDDIKNYINNLPQLIVQYRNDKDIGSARLLEEVEKYVKTMDKLLEIYKRINLL